MKLKAITGRSAPYLMIQPNYENDTIFHNQTKTYDITNSSYGLMKDIIDTLSTACNFTYEIHIRQDKKFGTITEFKNGTIVSSGMYESILDESGEYLCVNTES